VPGGEIDNALDDERVTGHTGVVGKNLQQCGMV